MTKTRALLPALVLVCAAVGCKQDEPSIDSGVAGGKQADELTPTEQEQLCEAIDAYGEQVLSEADLKRFLCTLQGIGFSLAQDGSVATCETVRDGCLEAPDDNEDPTTGGADSGATDTCSLEIDWANCTATVAEIEACYEEYGQMTKSLFTSYSCSKMAEYKANPPTNEQPPLGEACSKAQAKCPSVAPTGGEDNP